MGFCVYLAKLWNRSVRVKPIISGEYDVLLDLGCGMGHFSEALLKHAKYILGVDIHLPFLKEAKKKRVYGDLVQADIHHLPVQIDKVDCVTSFDVIEHLPKKDAMRLLKSFTCSMFLGVPRGDFSNVFYSKLTGNIFERHRSFWTVEDFEKLKLECEIKPPPLWLRLLPNQGYICAYKIQD